MKNKLNKDRSSNSADFYTRFQWGFLLPKYWSTWLILACSYLLYCLPAKTLDGIAQRLGDVTKKRNKKRYNIAHTNLKLCFPDLSEAQREQRISEHFRAQTRSILHYCFILWGSKKHLAKRIEFHGQEHIDASHAEGKSTIVMTVHSVGLESVAFALGQSYQVTALFNNMKNPLIDWMVARARRLSGLTLYTRDRGLRPVIKDVKAGYIMCYLPDEDLGAEQSIFVPLFGVQKATISVLGRLARSCNANVLPCISCYDPEQAKYHVHVLPKIENFPQKDDQLDALAMNRSIEQLIRLCPEQYFWTFRLFKTRPEGETRFY